MPRQTKTNTAGAATQRIRARATELLESDAGLTPAQAAVAAYDEEMDAAHAREEALLDEAGL